MKDIPDILRKICRAKESEIEALRTRGRAALETEAETCGPARGFRRTLASSEHIGLIAEVKKASPSAGVIREDFDPVAIARAYEKGGAQCLSVLTNREFFQGNLDYLESIRDAVELPLLRKDFILDELQVLEARAHGADCVLLIVAALEPDELAELLGTARELDMDALVEIHDEAELEVAIDAGADMIGVNNRNLHTFEVDLGVSERLAPKMPAGTVKVAESGVHSREDVKRLERAGFDAVLVGSWLMRQDDLAAATRKLIGK